MPASCYTAKATIISSKCVGIIKQDAVTGRVLRVYESR